MSLTSYNLHTWLQGVFGAKLGFMRFVSKNKNQITLEVVRELRSIVKPWNSTQNLEIRPHLWILDHGKRHIFQVSKGLNFTVENYIAYKHACNQRPCEFKDRLCEDNLTLKKNPTN